MAVQTELVSARYELGRARLGSRTVARTDGSIRAGGGGSGVAQRCRVSLERRCSRVGWSVRCGVRVTKANKEHGTLERDEDCVMTFA